MILIGNRGEFILDFFAFAKEGSSKGCLMAMIEGDLSKQITDFSHKNISPENLMEDGYETEPHITVLYGFHPDFDVNDLEDFLDSQGSIEADLGSVSRFECPEYDVLKLEVKSHTTHQLHHAIKQNLSNSISSKYPSYHPHVTLGYVKKGSHKELDGNNTFQGNKIIFNSLVFSPPDNSNRKSLHLGKKV